MAALLHYIVVEIENSRWKDHIRDWNTNMKVDMYDKMKELLKEEKKKKELRIDSVFDMIEDKDIRDYVVCEECECFRYMYDCFIDCRSTDENLYTCDDCFLSKNKE